jgi:hypothetical protein
MYQARVVKVMIASPDDVAPAREAARDVIRLWSELHAQERKIVLMPIGWETHARPDLGDRPQALVNKQVLKDCDVLVGIFWTRLGTPTGSSASGTVEEINEHVAAGKTAMIYFSREPVVTDNLDEEQWAALKQFKQECTTRGLIETFDSIADFRDKLTRQLTQLVFDKFHTAVLPNGSSSGAAPSGAIGQWLADVQRRQSDPLIALVAHLTTEARTLLLAGAVDANGTILFLRTMGGNIIQASGRQFGEPGEPRSEATWEGALNQLIREGLIQDAGHKREVFRLTDKGYRVADLFRSGAAEV